MNSLEKLQRHLESVDLIVHQEKYKKVMEELKIKASEKELKEYLFSFFENNPSKSTSLAKNLINEDSCEEVASLFENSTKTYKILGLNSWVTDEKVAEVNSVMSDRPSLKKAFKSSVEQFNQKVDIQSIDCFEESTKLTALKIFDHDNGGVCACLELLMTKMAVNNELVLALCLNPCLFKLCKPLVFVAVALPLLSNINYSTFIQKVYAHCKSFVIPRTFFEGEAATSYPKIEKPIVPLTEQKKSTLEQRKGGGILWEVSYIRKPLFYGFTTALIGYGAFYVNKMSLFPLLTKKAVVKALVKPISGSLEEAGRTAGTLVRATFIGFFKGLLSK